MALSLYYQEWIWDKKIILKFASADHQLKLTCQPSILINTKKYLFSFLLTALAAFSSTVSKITGIVTNNQGTH
jgi:hypothetical protein